MGNFIIKVEPDIDSYVVWSKSVEAPFAVLTREELVEWIIDETVPPARLRNEREYVMEEVNRKINRADETGTSLPHRNMGTWGWRETGYVQYEGKMLPFRNLPEFARRFREAQEAATEDGWKFTTDVSDLTEPFPEDEL